MRDNNRSQLGGGISRYRHDRCYRAGVGRDFRAVITSQKFDLAWFDRWRCEIDDLSSCRTRPNQAEEGRRFGTISHSSIWSDPLIMHARQICQTAGLKDRIPRRRQLGEDPREDVGVVECGLKSAAFFCSIKAPCGLFLNLL